MTPRLDLVTLVVEDYDTAIEFFVGVLGFDLIDDSSAMTESGDEKRWVVVKPPSAATGLGPGSVCGGWEPSGRARGVLSPRR